MIDLRSDTVTKPCADMRSAMAEAEVGDDILGDDPTVKKLEARVASMLGHQSGLFVPSGTMGNQLAVHVHTSPGDMVIVGNNCHMRHYEAGATAALSGVQLVEMPGEIFDLPDVATSANEYGRPRTSLVCVENTHNIAGGQPWPMRQLERLLESARQQGLLTHLDGARLWNAAAATGHRLEQLAGSFTTATVCLSKIIGAPAGSVLVGDTQTMARARVLRRRFGGAMRQVGVLAAAALVGLDKNWPNVAQAHECAALIYQKAELGGLGAKEPATNMLRVPTDSREASQQLAQALADQDILVLPGEHDIRIVTHLQVSKSDARKVAATLKSVLTR